MKKNKKNKLKKNKEKIVSNRVNLQPTYEVREVPIKRSKNYQVKYDENIKNDIEKVDFIFSEIIKKTETICINENENNSFRIIYSNNININNINNNSHQTQTQTNIFNIIINVYQKRINISYETHNCHCETSFETERFYKKWKKELEMLSLKFIKQKNEKLFENIFSVTNIGRKNKIQNFLDQNK